MPIDVATIGCHMFSATGRKFLRGPWGTGFLCVQASVGVHDPPFLDLHAATWTSTLEYEMRPDAVALRPGRATLPEARAWGCRGICAELGLSAIEERITSLASLMREKLAAIKGVRVHDQGVRRCGIVTFTKKEWDSDEITKALATRDIVVDSSFAVVPPVSIFPHGASLAWCGVRPLLQHGRGSEGARDAVEALQ